MRRIPFSPLLLFTALLLSAHALAQQPRTIDDLFSPRPTLPPPPPSPPPRPGGVQSAPLPPPPGAKSAPAVPAVAAPAPSRKDQPARKGRTPAPPQPSEVTVVQPPDQKIANPTATFSGLDKITGRIISFDVAINETVQFGALQVTPRACYTRPPTEIQNTTGFVEVEEITLDAKVRRLYSGWMFAASPGLHAVEHSIYDVWLTDCKATAPEIAKPQG